MTETAGLGHNEPPSPTEVYGPRIERLLMRLMELTTKPLTAEVASQLRDIVAGAISLDKDLALAKAKDKQPHRDAEAAIEKAYSPLVSDATRIRLEARELVDAYLVAEEKRRKAEAEEARLAAEKAAAAARQVETEDAAHEAKMAELAATHAERKADVAPRVGSTIGLGRATSLRSYWSVRVVDRDAMVTFFQSHPDVVAAATKAANALARTSKGKMPIPGCEMVEDRRSA